MFKSEMEILKSIQEMAEKSPSIEIFREQLKVIIWGLEVLSRDEEPE